MTDTEFRKDLEMKIIRKAWEDEDFRKQLLAEPRAAIQSAFEIPIPEDVEIKVVEETPKTVYMVLPPNPLAEEIQAQDSEGDCGLEAQTPWTY